MWSDVLSCPAYNQHIQIYRLIAFGNSLPVDRKVKQISCLLVHRRHRGDPLPHWVGRSKRKSSVHLGGSNGYRVGHGTSLDFTLLGTDLSRLRPFHVQVRT